MKTSPLRSRVAAVLTLSLAVVFLPAAHAQISFQWLPLSSATDVSADGTAVSGNVGASYQAQPAIWSAGGGLTLIPHIPGVSSVHGAGTTAISADGSTVTGTNNYGVGAMAARTQAYRWTASTGTVGLGALPGRVSSISTGISADGSVIVGYSESVLPGGGYVGPQAFRWTTGSGITSLGAGGSYSEAHGVSADGHVAAGSSSNGAFRWTVAEGVAALGHGHVLGMSGNGEYLVGYRNFDGKNEAFVWDETNGFQALGFIPITHHNGSFATLISDDARLIIGSTYTQHDIPVGFIWTPESGLRFTSDVLMNEYGLAAEFAGYQRIGITGISDDGRFLVGTAFDQNFQAQAWWLDRGLNPPVLGPNELPPLRAVPEPSTYGIAGALLLIGLLGRRWQSRRLSA